MATLYYRNVATGWNVTTSWSTSSSSGASAGVIPTATDDVIVNSGSNSACTISTTAGVCKSINITGYTGTLTANVNLTISGNVTLGIGMLFGGTGTWIVNATSSLTSNGLTFLPKFTCSSAVTLTFVDNWTFSGATTLSGGCVLNRTDSTHGNILFSGTGVTTGGVSGTSQFTFGSNTTHTGSNALSNPIVIDAGVGTYSFTGTITGVTSLIYVSGTTNMNTSTVQLANNAVLNTNSSNSTSVINSTGINFYILILCPIGTINCNITISSNLTSCNTLQNAGANSSVTINGAYTVYANGNLTVLTNGGGAVTNPSLSANSIVMAGTGTLNMTNNGLNGSLIINTAGTITINNFIGNSFTYTAGTINATSSVFVCGYASLNSGNITINSGFIQWSTFTCTIPVTAIILNSTLLVTTMTLPINGVVPAFPFTGISGFTVNTLICTAASNGYIGLTVSNTYMVNNTMTFLNNSSIATPSIKSLTPGTRATFILANGATQNNQYITATDIDSSAGQTIWVWQGTFSNNLNWRVLSATSVQYSSTFVN